MLEELGSFARRPEAAAKASFVAAHPGAWLVIGPFYPLDASGQVPLTKEPGKAALYVTRVEKRTKTPGSMITAGRAQTNDVVIREETVSKFHAYFMRTDEADRFTLTDAGSANGSAINGKKLEPKTEHVVLVSGDEIKLGELRIRFYDAAELFAFIEATRAVI